ncbi:hypothetical protein [Arthrospiribacter ruber]|uniref:Uncharacterized protein n=1 Tax=Arthrospiribacter ruber TaxID=2487934 RepID=A0A951IVJ1_9BACT|nr:hypothetical protein [Arthrospiribacter ruber]MBW3466398.1 hypothetical protein [Arthrospiribacter ruber]
MILADHYYKISHTQKPYVLEIENWKFDTEKYFSWVAEKKAKVYCKMFFPLGLFEVERHVVKEQHRTTSFYLFMLDKEVFAFWHKKYDYGRDRLSVIEEDIFPAGMFIEPILKNEEEPILVKGPENQILYVEKFVHTHLFYIRDQEKFNQLIRQIKDLKILP